MVYVISKKGEPLMPCTEAKSRKLLRDKKAKCIRRTPFTIKLNFDCEGNVQKVIAGMDTGSKTIGCAVVGNNKILYQSEVLIRQDVSKKMEQRKIYRRNRRSRKTRYRASRFLNRGNSKKENRIAPSIRSKIDAHLREKKFIESIFPISKWILETASFDIHKISNPDVKKWEYQKGQQKDFYNVKAFVLNRDNYTCQKCKTKEGKLHVHHIVFRSQGGSNSPENLITLCENCHNKLHKGEFTFKGKSSITKHATEIGIIKSQLKKIFGMFEETFGYITKYNREQILKLTKTHFNDAIAICCGGNTPKLLNYYFIKRNVSKGDYQLCKGSRGEKKIPVGKLFGFRKFDLIKTPKGVGFIKGKRSSGFFDISDIFGNSLCNSVNVKKECSRLSARKTNLIWREGISSQD